MSSPRLSNPVCSLRMEMASGEGCLMLIHRAAAMVWPQKFFQTIHDCVGMYFASLEPSTFKIQNCDVYGGLSTLESAPGSTLLISVSRLCIQLPLTAILSDVTHTRLTKRCSTMTKNMLKRESGKCGSAASRSRKPGGRGVSGLRGQCWGAMLGAMLRIAR